MRTKELIEYLKQYPDDAKIGILIANPKARLIYCPLKLNVITDEDCPIFCIEVGDVMNMDEDMIKACEEDESEVADNE